MTQVFSAVAERDVSIFCLDEVKRFAKVHVALLVAGPLLEEEEAEGIKQLRVRLTADASGSGSYAATLCSYEWCSSPTSKAGSGGVVALARFFYPNHPEDGFIRGGGRWFFEAKGKPVQATTNTSTGPEVASDLASQLWTSLQCNVHMGCGKPYAAWIPPKAAEKEGEEGK